MTAGMLAGAKMFTAMLDADPSFDGYSSAEQLKAGVTVELLFTPSDRGEAEQHACPGDEAPPWRVRCRALARCHPSRMLILWLVKPSSFPLGSVEGGTGRLSGPRTAHLRTAWLRKVPDRRADRVPDAVDLVGVAREQMLDVALEPATTRGRGQEQGGLRESALQEQFDGTSRPSPSTPPGSSRTGRCSKALRLLDQDRVRRARFDRLGGGVAGVQATASLGSLGLAGPLVRPAESARSGLTHRGPPSLPGRARSAPSRSRMRAAIASSTTVSGSRKPPRLARTPTRLA